MADYRNSKYCSKLSKLKQKKQGLVNAIKKEHPKQVDMHSVVSKNGSQEKKEFVKIYNYKCAYCGASLDILGNISDFEIDHFKNEKSFPSKAKAGSIDNLVLACRTCNRNKSSFYITDSARADLHPDEQKITKNFLRDESYYIVLSDKAKTKKDVQDFYNTLNLNNETRRIDFLLININGLIKRLEKKKYNDVVTINMLRKIKDKLFEKRKVMKNS